MTPSGGPSPSAWWLLLAWLWPAAPGSGRRCCARGGRLAPTGWWRRWPPLPRPDPAYLRFRLQTAYGDPGRDPDPGDVVTYLRWCRRRRREGG